MWGLVEGKQQEKPNSFVRSANLQEKNNNCVEPQRGKQTVFHRLYCTTQKTARGPHRSPTHCDRQAGKYLEPSCVGWLVTGFDPPLGARLTFSQNHVLQLLHSFCEAGHISQQGRDVLHFNGCALWGLRLRGGGQGALSLAFGVDPWWERKTCKKKNVFNLIFML